MPKKTKSNINFFDIFKTVNSFVYKLNHSKFFAGLVMVMLNVGSKYVTIKLSDSQRNILNKYSIFRQLLIFSVFWMGTKDLYTSLIMTAVFIILTQHIFNEESKFCLMPKKWMEFETAMDKNKDGVLSEEEIDNAIKILHKTKIQQKTIKDENIKRKINREFMRNRI